MNFDQNDNFEKSLFNTEDTANSLEINIGNLDSEDIPPELDPIKNLSDATVSEAPTMDALDPINFITEITPKSNDPLDMYEKYGFNKDIDTVTPSLKEDKPMEFSNYDQLLNLNINSSDIPSFNTEQKEINKDIPNFSTHINSVDDGIYNLGINNDENSLGLENNAPFLKDNTIILGRDSNEEEKDNSYEIVEKSLLSNNEEKELTELNEVNNKLDLRGEVDLSDIVETENSDSKDDIIDDENEDKYFVLEKGLANNLTSDLENNVDSSDEDLNILGLDEVYTEPDSLEIIDDDMIDDTPETKESSIEKIKLLIDELKSKGEKIKVEEFDFESMHQLIVIIEK